MITIDHILRAFHDDLLPWLKERKGELSIARDPIEPLEILTQAPGKFLVILHWAGDDQVGDQDAEAIGNNAIEIYVGRGLGLTSVPQQALLINRPGGPGLLRLVNDVRARVLSLGFPQDDTLETLAYGGAQAVTLPNGVALAAYKFTVRLQAEIEVEETREAEIAED